MPRETATLSMTINGEQRSFQVDDTIKFPSDASDNAARRPDIRALCVFAGSRMGLNGRFRAAAERLGQLMAERGIRLVYGGGAIGLMGVLAKSVLDHGGEVTGIIPDFLMTLEVGDPGVTELIVVGSMHERKARMFDLSDGFVVLPGGLGTLDETIEWRPGSNFSSMPSDHRRQRRRLLGFP